MLGSRHWCGVLATFFLHHSPTCPGSDSYSEYNSCHRVCYTASTSKVFKDGASWQLSCPEMPTSPNLVLDDGELLSVRLSEDVGTEMLYRSFKGHRIL